jgi:hypothetical protein
MRSQKLGRWIGIVLAAACAATTSGAFAADPMPGEKAQPTTSASHGGHEAKGDLKKMEGEVLDLHCFMLHPENGQGADHAKCAEMCINKGLPVGFRSSTGEIYLLLGGGHDPVKTLVAQHAGVPVRVEGVVVEHDGVRALQLKTIENLAQSAPEKKATTESSHNH